MASAFGTPITWTGASMTFSRTVMWDHRLKPWNTKPRRASDAFDLFASAAPARRPIPFAHADSRRRGDAALVRRFQKIDAAQKRAFARSARPQDRDDIAFGRVQRHALQDLNGAERLVHVLGTEGDAVARFAGSAGFGLVHAVPRVPLSLSTKANAIPSGRTRFL
jgi:hypothetical protein